MISVLVLAGLLLLILLDIPIAIATGLVTLVAVLFLGTLPLSIIPQYLYESMANYGLIAAPLFILAGQFMESGGISLRLVNFALTIVGRLKGGLAHATVVASMFMAGVSGSAVADASAMGSISIPAMVRRGYPKGFTAALLALCGAIGCIIPPSIPMVVLAVVTNTSIGGLFLGGAIPGFFVGLGAMLVSYFVAHRYGLPMEKRASFREFLQALGAALPALLIPVFIVLGIFGGVFTVTEVSGIVAAYCFVLGAFGYRELKIRDVPKMLLRSVQVTSAMVSVLAFCGVFAALIIYEQVPERLAAQVFALTKNPTLILAGIMVVLLMLGCVIDVLPNILITAPVLLPMVVKLGVDPVYFGVLTVFTLCLGLVTPPVGATLFVAIAIAKIKQQETYRFVAMLMATSVAVLVIILLIPQVVMFLPNLILRK